MELMIQEKHNRNQISEIGRFPDYWNSSVLKELSSFITKGSTPTTYGFQWQKSGIQFLRSECVSDNGLDLEASKFISNKANEALKRSEIKSGDILTTITGNVGRFILLDSDFGQGNINQHIARIRIQSEDVDTIYLFYFLSRPEIRDYFNSITTGQAYPQISLKQVRELPVYYPPTLAEQQTIAEALSDVDELIRSFDGLIQKKQAIKKGTMQQLFTCIKRLPGFDGEWEVKKLGEIGNTINGLSGKTKADFGDGNHPYITFMNVMNNTVINTSIFDTVKVRRGESQSEIKKGDLLFNTSSETPDEVGMCSVLLDDVESLHLNSFCFGYRIHEQDEVLPLFLAYYFRSEFGRKHMQALAQGSTRYNLSKSKFVKIEIELPIFEEQKAIAQILSDMDQELQTLRQKREKYVQIKQGMMQELLTGKVRLVKQKSEHIQKAQPKRQRSWAFEEAVIISTLIDRFNKGTFFLSRFRYVKYSYLLKRYNEMDVANYMKKAAGPYNPQTRYGGPERIAKDKNYIIPATSGKYKGFKPGDNVEEATGYFKDWFGTEILDWLEQFRFTKNDELELITTVDLAMQDLKESGKSVSLESVKMLIGDHEEWRPKLKRKVFSDERIEYAIDKANKLFI